VFSADAEISVYHSVVYSAIKCTYFIWPIICTLFSADLVKNNEICLSDVPCLLIKIEVLRTTLIYSWLKWNLIDTSFPSFRYLWWHFQCIMVL